MTTFSPLEGEPWPPRRYLTVILVFLVIHVGLIWFLGDRDQPAQPPETFETRVHLAGESWPPPYPHNQLLVRDPALIPLPSQEGFSGRAWLQYITLDYSPGSWTDSAQWLALDALELGGTLQQLVGQQHIPPRSIADKPIPSLAVDELVIPNLLPPLQSQLEVAGKLADRRLISTPPLPSWPHADILTNTVVQVAVQPDGLVYSTVLLSPCGLPEADLFALEVAQAIRFTPVAMSQMPAASASRPLAFGTLRFRWHTLPPPPPINTAQVGP